MFTVLSALIVILGACVICLHIKHERKFGRLRKIFPGCVWFLNVRLHHLLNPENALKITTNVYKSFKNNVLYLMYPHAKLLLYDLKLIDLVLSTNMDKTVEYSFIKSWLSEGILTSKYDKWKVHKKLLAPAFSMKNLMNHIDAFNEQSLVLCNKLQDRIDQPSFNIHKYINLCTMDIILNTALGADIKIQDNPTSEYMTSAHTMCNILYKRGFSLSRYDWFYYFTSDRKLEQQCAKYLNDFSNKFITERRHSKSAGSVRTILDMLLECEELSDKDVCAEINTFIFAGHETTGSTLSFALYELSRNPDIQTKVYNEIITVVGNDNAPTYNDLESLPYTSMMLKEVSRLYPGVPFISRYINKEITWNGYVLPTGLECYLSLLEIHRNEDYFEEPEKFDPERFNDVNVKKIPTGAYIPFSIAPRGCIGQKFAQLQMKTILIHLLRQYEFLPDWEHELHLVTNVTLQSKNGIKLRIKKR